MRPVTSTSTTPSEFHQVCKDDPTLYSEGGIEALLWTLFSVEKRLTLKDIRAYLDGIPVLILSTLLRKMERENVIAQRYGKWEYLRG